MTREEFHALDEGPNPLPIRMLNNDIGLCSHQTDTEILVDVYSPDSRMTEIRVPFERARVLSGSALVEISQAFIDHLAWAKERALTGLATNGVKHAVQSIVMDLTKHEETQSVLTKDFLVESVLMALNNDVEATKTWIEAIR